MIDYLMRKGNEWRKNKPQGDDITFVVIEIS
jgi:hypothetical protein